MGMTRDLFKKFRDINGTFHEKIGTIKYRNCVGLTEAEDIKKRWREYTEQYKKITTIDPITTVVQLLTQSQTSVTVKSSEAQGVLL